MNKHITKKFVENTGFICTNCAKIVVDGHKHDKEEDLYNEIDQIIKELKGE